MAEILFYHLTQRPLEHALPELLEKTLKNNWRAAVRCGTTERVESLNASLWSYKDVSFLPHGSAADNEPTAQPIYLTSTEETPNNPDLLFLVDGAEASPAELAEYIRAIWMFDGHDPVALNQARTGWKAVSAANLPATYWAQNDHGGWVKKAESGHKTEGLT